MKLSPHVFLILALPSCAMSEKQAQITSKNAGSAMLARQPIEFGRVIGEGYKVVTLSYGKQTQAIVRVNSSGQAYTAYPRYGY